MLLLVPGSLYLRCCPHPSQSSCTTTKSPTFQPPRRGSRGETGHKGKQFPLFKFFFKKSLSIYSVVPISAVHHLTQSYIYIHTYIYIFFFFFSNPPPSWSIPRDWTQFPVLYSRTSLFIHSQCNNSKQFPFKETTHHFLSRSIPGHAHLQGSLGNVLHTG